MAQKATLEPINTSKYTKVDDGQGFRNYITPLDQNNMNNMETELVNLNELTSGENNVLNRNFNALNEAIGNINTLPSPEAMKEYAGNVLTIDENGNINPIPFSYNELADKLKGSDTINIDSNNTLHLSISPSFNAAIIEDTIGTSNVQVNVIDNKTVMTITLNRTTAQLPGNNILHLMSNDSIAFNKDTYIRIVASDSPSNPSYVTWWNPITGTTEQFKAVASGSFDHLLIYLGSDPISTETNYSCIHLITNPTFNYSEYTKQIAENVGGSVIKEYDATLRKTTEASSIMANIVATSILSDNIGSGALIKIIPDSAFSWSSGEYIMLTDMTSNISIPLKMNTLYGVTNQWPRDRSYTYNSDETILVYLSNYTDGYYHNALWLAPTTSAHTSYVGDWYPDFPSASPQTTVTVNYAKFTRNGDMVTCWLDVDGFIGNSDVATIINLPYNCPIPRAVQVGVGSIQVNWATNYLAAVELEQNYLKIYPYGISGSSPITKLRVTFSYPMAIG